MAENKSNKLIHLTLVLIASMYFGCTTVPLEGQGMVVSEQKPTGSCSSLGTVTGEESGFSETTYVNARNKMLNAAAQLRANYVQIVQSDTNLFKSNYIGLAFQCISNADLPESELKINCNKNDADSCFDYAYRLATDKKYSEADIPLDRACKLGHQEACDTQKKYGRDLKTQKEISSLNNQCVSGNGKSCLSLSFIVHRYGYVNDAIFLAQKACLKDVQEGCKFYSRLMDEKNNLVAEERQQQVQNQNQQIQQEQLRLQRAAMIEQMRQNQYNNWTNALQRLSDSENAKTQQAAPQQTNCVTRSRTNIAGQIEYYTDCESN